MICAFYSYDCRLRIIHLILVLIFQNFLSSLKDNNKKKLKHLLHNSLKYIKMYSELENNNLNF